MNMMSRERVYLLLLLFAASAFLAGCGSTAPPGSAALIDGVTPTPSPTADPSGYQAIAPLGCLVAEMNSLQTDRPSGNLLAWQPGTERLAYLSPNDRSSWYTGNLVLVEGPDYNAPLLLAPNILVTGDLTWSPSGRQLAFLAFRPDENVYTVMVVQADGSGLIDLFPTDLARTDARTSQKAIIAWKSDDLLQVMASCGEECRQSFDIQIGRASSPALAPTLVPDYHDLAENLQTQIKSLEFLPERYPKGMNSPHWSPDEKQIAYLDRRGLLWVLSTGEKTTYLLDIGLRDVLETQWSSASDRIAIRAEDRIFLFEVPCRQ